MTHLIKHLRLLSIALAVGFAPACGDDDGGDDGGDGDGGDLDGPGTGGTGSSSDDDATLDGGETGTGGTGTGTGTGGDGGTGTGTGGTGTGTGGTGSGDNCSDYTQADECVANGCLWEGEADGMCVGDDGDPNCEDLADQNFCEAQPNCMWNEDAGACEDA